MRNAWLIVLLLAFNCFSQVPVLVSWDANSEDDLAGYKVHLGESSNIYPVVINAGDTTAFLWKSLEYSKAYYFAVTAYDFSGNESEFSDEVFLTTPDKPDEGDITAPAKPINVHIQVVGDSNSVKVKIE